MPETNGNIALRVELLQLINREQAWEYKIIPKNSSEKEMTFYVDENADNIKVQKKLELSFGKSIRLEKTSTSVIQKALGKYYRKGEQERKRSKEQLDISFESDDFLTNLITEAKHLDSSDIHVESYKDRCRVRIRIDGVLTERYTIKQKDYAGFVNKIKVDAELNVSERRLPQDGRISFNKGGEEFDIRVSVTPNQHGEKVVMRLLNTGEEFLNIDKLGFTEQALKDYMAGVKKPHGIILISGPTGSGKSRTLYATMKLINSEDVNIQTIEDPVEITLSGINQAQVKDEIGYTFSSALRTFLRQDPDILMVGEIRDKETAALAIQASLTGHLVLSTLHTNSAWGIISRLKDLGVEPFLIGDTLNTAVAQRLVRLLCEHCKVSEKFNTSLLPENFHPAIQVKEHYTAHPEGCEHCDYRSYKGRKGIFEVIPIDTVLRKKIKAGDLDVSERLKEMDIKSLADNAFELFASGETSLDQIYSILSDV